MLEIGYEIENPIDSTLGCIIRCYEAFYRKVNRTQIFSFKPSQREKSTIFNFIEQLNESYGIESIGDRFIFDYFTFQIDYWDSLETRFDKKIPISWMIGKKAFERWEVRREKDLWHAKQTIKKYGITFSEIASQDNLPKSTDLNEHEEIEKERFYGTPEGLVNCVETTTLFNHNSNLCRECFEKDTCKKMLKRELPKVYILRGYLKNEKNTLKSRKRI